MKDALLVLLQLGLFGLASAALVRPSLRRKTAFALLGGAAAALIGGLLTEGPRTLDLVHHYSAYDGNRIIWKPFPVETVESAPLLWGLVTLGFALPWAFWFLATSNRSDEQQPDSPLAAIGTPLLLAWSGLALILGWQVTAAPEALVEPVGFDRVLLPASIAAAIRLSYALRKVLPTILWLSLFVTTSRGPLAVFGVLATQNAWGTSMDVRNVDKIASPIDQKAMRLAEGTWEQLAWVVAGPHLFVFPALYMLSLVGISFGITMWITHPPGPRPTA